MVAVAAKGVADGRPIVSPDVAQGVQKWVDRTLPGPNHEALGYFVGRWNAEVIYSNLPGAMSAGKDARTRGSVVTTWTHGKRFLRSEYTGGVGGPDFSATSTIGFNNAVGRFEGTWMDSTATGVRTSTGSVDATGKVFTLVSTFPDPINGSQTTFKEVLTINAPNRYTHQVFEVGRNRTEHRIREVVFTRAK